MNTMPPERGRKGAPFEVLLPDEQRLPIIVASPHSGRDYPSAFVRDSRLDAAGLRRSEDSYVEEIFGAAPAMGAPLLRALFPRAYVDANREPYELDASMFADPLPPFANTASPRVAAGLGTIARVVASGVEIYRGKLRWADAERRIEDLYKPYHRTLTRLVETTKARFGYCILLDCHSMPSTSAPQDREGKAAGSDIVLGDCFGVSCAGVVSETADNALAQRGYRVYRNSPYAGGYTTQHYGRPNERVHALQIEINRKLYMDEHTHERLPSLARLTCDMRSVIDALTRIPAQDLGA